MSLKKRYLELKKLMPKFGEPYIEGCYNQFLKRDPDNSGGKNYYKHSHSLTGKISIVRGIATSFEGKDKGNQFIITLILLVPLIIRELLKSKTQSSVSKEKLELKTACPSDFIKFRRIKSHYTEDSFIKTLVKKKVIKDKDSYLSIYGKRDGYHIQKEIVVNKNKKIIIVSPSHQKKCGIGEYGTFLEECFKKAGFETRVVRRTDEILGLEDGLVNNSIILVNHGPGLFDGYNPRLSEGETTIELIKNLLHLESKTGSKPIIFLHSLLDVDNKDMYGRQSVLINSGIPCLTTIRLGAEKFRIGHIEHGIQPIAAVEDKAIKSLPSEKIQFGFFGFFQWGGKDFETLIQVVSSLKAKLVGSVATTNDEELAKLRTLLTEKNIECDLGSGWIDSENLAKRLSTADLYYMPQNDYDHWNNSGSARLACNFSKPVIVPPHMPFLEMANYVIFSEKNDVPRVISSLKSKGFYEESKRLVDLFKRDYSMELIPELITQNLLDNYYISNIRSLISENCYSEEYHLLHGIDAEENDYSDEIEPLDSFKEALPNLDREVTLLRGTYKVVPEIKLWKHQYNIFDFVYMNYSDVLVNAIRSILKREVQRIEKAEFDNLFQRDYKSLLSAAYILDLVSILFQRSAASASQSPEIFFEHEGKSGVVNFNDQAELAKVSSILEERMSRTSPSLILRSKRVENTIIKFYSTYDSHGRYINLFQLLILPKDQIVKTMTRLNGEIDEDVISKIDCSTLRKSFHSFNKIMLKHGLDIKEHFILDHPTTPAINHFKYCYHFNEIALFNGHEYIINLFRMLSKRNPYIFEYSEYKESLVIYGKKHLMKHHVKKNNCNGYVVDLELGNPYDCDLSAENEENHQFILDFRDPIAGGIQSRNQYLMDKRNFHRLWLKYESDLSGYL